MSLIQLNSHRSSGCLFTHLQIYRERVRSQCIHAYYAINCDLFNTHPTLIRSLTHFVTHKKNSCKHKRLCDKWSFQRFYTFVLFVIVSLNMFVCKHSCAWSFCLFFPFLVRTNINNSSDITAWVYECVHHQQTHSYTPFFKFITIIIISARPSIHPSNHRSMITIAIMWKERRDRKTTITKTMRRM